MRKFRLVTRPAMLMGFLLASQFVQAQAYQKIHQEAIVIDSHNDVLINVLEGLKLEDNLRGKTHSDLSRFREGGVDIQFFSVWSDETYGKGKGFTYANRQIDSLYAIAARNPDKMMMVTSTEELQTAVQQNKLGAMIGVEGGHMMEDNLGYLEELYKRGTRYMTLTWNNSTSWASSAKDETDGTVPKAKRGLNSFGKQVVQRMNALGMMVDLSHVGERTFWDAMKTTTKPVLVSHSCVYRFNPHPRNLKDDQIKAVAKNGGVIQLNFFSGFLDPQFDARQSRFLAKHQTEVDSLKKKNFSNGRIRAWLETNYPKEAEAVRPPLSLLLDHLDYIVKLTSVDHVGLGSDFDGVTSTPQQLDGVEDFPIITKELLARGYSQQDVHKILGGNLLRVFKANEN